MSEIFMRLLETLLLCEYARLTFRLMLMIFVYG